MFKLSPLILAALSPQLFAGGGVRLALANRLGTVSNIVGGVEDGVVFRNNGSEEREEEETAVEVKTHVDGNVGASKVQEKFAEEDLASMEGFPDLPPEIGEGFPDFPVEIGPMANNLAFLRSLSDHEAGTPFPPAFDCSTLAAMIDENPTLMSHVPFVKADCDEGLISTAEEVAHAIAQHKNATLQPVQDQIAATAASICDGLANRTVNDFENSNLNSNLTASNITDIVATLQTYCETDPRNNEAIVDTASNLSPHHDDPELFASLDQACERYSEIHAALSTLDKGRHLQDSDEDLLDGHQVSSAEIGTDLVDVLDVYCDKSNPGNIGLSTVLLTFAEHVTLAVEQQTKRDALAGEDPGTIISQVQESLEKHTGHLRHSESGVSQDDVEKSVSRAMSELEVEKCAPPGVMQDPVTGGIKMCIYAGSVFDCEVSWDPRSAGCTSIECGAGVGVKLVGSASLCIIHQPGSSHGDWTSTVTLELKVCVDVVSDILKAVGRLHSEIEKLFNRFGIYAGCYRLGIMTYDIGNNRFDIQIGPHKRWFLNFYVSAYVNVRARVKPHGCNYDDNKDWYTRDWVANFSRNGLVTQLPDKERLAGIFWTKGSWSGVPTKNCRWKIGSYALITFGFSIGAEWIFTESKYLTLDKTFLAGKPTPHPEKTCTKFNIYCGDFHRTLTTARDGQCCDGSYMSNGNYALYCNNSNGWCVDTIKNWHGAQWSDGRFDYYPR